MDGTNLGVVEQLAGTLRRMAGNEDYDAQGVRTVWHRGRMCELLSWESKEGRLVKQELTIAGSVVEYRDGSVLRTGRVPPSDDSESGAQQAKTIDMDAQLSAKALQYAAHFLKKSPTRDFYTQHLLKHVNAALSSFGEEQTNVMNPQAFGREAARPGKKKRQRAAWGRGTAVAKLRVPLGAIVAIAAIAGLIAGLLALIV